MHESQNPEILEELISLKRCLVLFNLASSFTEINSQKMLQTPQSLFSQHSVIFKIIFTSWTF